MTPTKFLEPTDFSEASSLLAQYGDDAKLIAGGTSVVLMLQQKLIAPTVLINLGRILHQNFIHNEPDGLHLGALTTLHDAEQSQIVNKFCPALAHTFSVVGNIRVRHQATVGGNLAAADYAADPPSMLMALDARVQVLGPERKREIPLGDFFLSFYTTTLEPAEIITEIVVPVLPSSARAARRSCGF
jgi:CO/xanthine dehydrogenase FAD-binding subunit